MDKNIHNNDLQLSQQTEDSLDISEILKWIWDGKFIVIFSTALLAIASVSYSLSIDNIYKSEAILIPAESESSFNSNFQGLSNLAGLAGINLASSSGSKKASHAIKKSQSFSFYNENILPNLFLPNLIALKSWNPDTLDIIYNDEIYDTQKNNWVSGYAPSPQLTYESFSKIFNIENDPRSGLIRISITHSSPIIAKEWVELIVSSINESFREDDKYTAQSSINFLNNQMSTTPYAEIKMVLSELIKVQIQKLTLIEANKDYIFKYIDPPVIPERKFGPNRKNICIWGTIFGFLVGIFLVLAMRFFKSLKK